MTVKMLSKVAFASLAFACVDAAYAADIDTTPGVTLSAENKYIGAGTLTVSGGGDVWLGGGGGSPITEFAMTGGLIDIVSGTTLKNGGWQKGVWTDNKAGMQVNGTLDVFDGNNIFADALTGSGTVTMGDISWSTLNKSITVGVNGGGGTFTGTISDSGDDTLSLIKTGGGTQILTGANTYRGATTINGGTLRIVGNSSGAGALTVASGARLGGTGSYGGSITMLAGAGLNCELSVTDSTLTCAGQLSFNNLDFESCAFTGAVGAGYPPYRRIPLIEAASLGTTTFANGASSTEGTIAGVPAKLYLKGNILMLDVGYTPGTRISFF